MPLETVTVRTGTYVYETSTYTCEVCKAQKVVESGTVGADPPKGWIGLITGEWFDRYDHLASWATTKGKK